MRRQAMQAWLTAIGLSLTAVSSSSRIDAQPSPPPIIDMHMHADRADAQGPPPLALCPGDPAFEPYLALAEELDVPLSIHVGTGPPGAPYLGFPKYRARLHSPLLIEETLLKHPKLRVSLMHAGWPMLDESPSHKRT